MKRRVFNVCTAIYVTFAILVAHSALAPSQTTASQCPHSQTVVAVAEGSVQHLERLHQFDKEAETDKPNYTIEVWSSEWCSGCRTYKAEEVPTLLKLGYVVNFKDYQKDERPDEVKELPTVALLYKGKPIKYVVYWKAADLDKFVKDNTKPDPEIPDHIYSPKAT